MTDQELDQMMRRALLDAAAQEAETLPQEPPELSPRHGRSMRAMLRDPLAWARSRRRPALRTAARHAAAVLLMLLYNGQRGKGHKQLFYWFYPAHVYLLYGASCLVYNVLR